MLLRVLSILAALAGSFGIAAWAVAPIGDWGIGSAATKGDRLPVAKSAIVASRERASAPSGTPEVKDATAAQPRAPAASMFDVALFNPTATLPAPIHQEPTRPPGAKEAVRPEHKPFTCPHTPSARSDLLTVAQIARFKAALNLTPAQEKDWRPVEAGLTQMAQQIERARGEARKIVFPADQTQRLYLAAGPLVLSLREEQKRDARNLACSLGLAAVAALI